MKEYKSSEDLIDYLISKGVVIKNKKDAIRKIEKYTYYAIINTYKEDLKMMINILLVYLLTKYIPCTILIKI